MGTSDWQSRYVRSRFCNVCRTNQGRKIQALWGNTKYRKTYNVILEFAGETSPLCSIIFNNFFTYNF
jgi:hypothetical protein